MFGLNRRAKERRDAAYWRKAYEDLVRETGRDLNDGLGLDPRMNWLPASLRAARDCRCEICLVPFVAGDDCMTDIDLGPVHAACCGSERESYVNLETGEPIGADAPIPTPWKWR